MAGKGNPNPSPGTRFKKGDPRIWKGGRPKSFDGLRELAQQIASEVATDSEGKALVRDGHSLTVAEAIMRKWAASKDTRLQIAFVEIAYGKVPTKHEVTGADGGPIQTQNVFDHGAAVAGIAQRSGGDRGESGDD